MHTPAVVALALILMLTGCVADVEPDDPDVQTETADDPEAGGGQGIIDERDGATRAVFADNIGDSPGCAVAVQSPDGAYTAEAGLADLNAGTPITRDTIFDIGSVSKQITAGAVMLLVLDGQVSLEDPIHELMPALPAYDPPITLGDLVHHTSGLPDYIDGIEQDLDEVSTADDALAVILSPDGEPTDDPQTAFAYSNTNYFLMGQIVESVTGDSLVDFADREIFEPLGMTASNFRDDQGTLLDGQATGYEGLVVTGSVWQQTGDGAVHATAVDLLAWANLFLNEPTAGGLGSQEWLDLMTTPGAVPDEDGVAYGGGLELGSTDDGASLLTHGGSWIGYGSALAMIPEEGVAVAVTCNLDGIDAEGLAAETLAIWRP